MSLSRVLRWFKADLAKHNKLRLQLPEGRTAYGKTLFQRVGAQDAVHLVNVLVFAKLFPDGLGFPTNPNF